MSKRDIKSRLLGIVLALLAVILVAGAGKVTSALSVPLEASSAQAGDLVLQPAGPGLLLPSGSNTINNSDTVKDYAGNLFTAYLVTNGNDTYVHVTKTAPSGVIVAVKDAVPATASNGLPYKANSASIMLDNDDLHIAATGYELTTPTRENLPLRVVWQDIAVPFPQGVNPYQGGGAAVFAGVQPQQGGISEQRFREIMREESERAVQRAIDNMIPKMKAALQQEGVLTERMFFGAQGSYSVWRQLTDTSFTGALGAIRAYYATPTATAVPRP